MKSSNLIPFVRKSVENNMPILVVGEPGVGKTESIEQAINGMDAELYVRHAICMEPIDFRGFPCLFRDDTDKDKSYAQFVPYGDLNIMLNADKTTVFFYDDLGQASQSVQKAMMQLFLQREVNGKRISDHVRFIGATNRRGDRAGVNGLITPLISRQKCVVNFTIDVEDWVKWAYDNNIPPILIAFVHFRGAELLLDFDPNKVDDNGNDLVQQPSPRTVASVGHWMNLGYDPKKDMEIFEGTIGKAFAMEFAGFIDLYDKLGNLPNDIASGKGGECPSDPASMYALASALANKCDADHRSNIYEWCEENFPAEFQQVLILDAESIHKDDFKNSDTYNLWVTYLRNK
jgi:hypothetical protein